MFRTDLDVVEEVMGSSGAAARERHGAEALTVEFEDDDVTGLGPCQCRLQLEVALFVEVRSIRYTTTTPPPTLKIIIDLARTPPNF